MFKKYVLPEKRTLVIAFVCLFLTSATTALLAKSLKPIFDDIFIGHKKGLLYSITGGVMAAFIIKGACEYISSLCLERLGQKMSLTIQTDLFKKIVSLPLDFFRKEHESHHVSLMTHDVHTLRDTFIQAIVGIGRDIFTIAGLLAVLLQENVFLSLFSLFGLPIAGGLLFFFSRTVRSLSINVQKKLGSLNSLFHQTFHNIMIVKAYNTEEEETKRLKKHLDHLFMTHMHNARIRSMTHPLMEIAGGFAISAVIIYGGTEVMTGNQTTGSFLSFITALFFIYRPMKSLLQFNHQLQAGLGCTQRILTVLNQTCPTEDLSPPPYSSVKGETSPKRPAQDTWVRDISVFAQDIRLENVSFQYPETTTKVLKDVSLIFPKNKRSALVGPSGGGKSTLFTLLLKLYKSTSGTILFGDADIQHLEGRFLRDHISFVSQDTFLFDDTVAYNIAYGCPDATLEDIIESAHKAFAHTFIEALPQGYQTFVGPHGTKLSGGQRQRLSLARAFLKKAPILLLDEATAALDNACETHIQEALDLIGERCTTIVIAHRLSTIQHVDKIFVIDQNMLAEEGTHDELLAQRGIYHSLWVQKQF